MNGHTLSSANLRQLAEAFQLPAPPLRVSPLGSGNVNSTYLVETAKQDFVLQRLNTSVFQKPEAVMGNLLELTAHIQQRIRKAPATVQALLKGQRWELPRLVNSCSSDRAWHRCEQGGFWRMMSFVADSRCVEVIENRQQANELGRGLGLFHHLIHDLPVDRLTDTLEGFHVTPLYLQAYHKALIHSEVPSCSLTEFCLKFIREREAKVDVLEQAKARGELPLRPIHGDPKINNMLLDQRSGKAVAMIDLDTVKPGLVHYDIGDCLRSGCNALGEETEDFEAVHFDLALAEAILSGYLDAAGTFLSEDELRYIPAAAELLPFELGLRFFTDHLNGNSYFRANHGRHNLHRAVVQFQLTASIEAQQHELQTLLARLTNRHLAAA